MGLFDEQLHTRQLLDEEELEKAYAKLAASASGGKWAKPDFKVEDARAIDVACAQILAFYGQRPARVPDDVVDPYVRLERELGNTGVMTRAVTFRGSWWKNCTGVYLGRLKQGTPVAIVPAGMRGYAYVDPATKKKVIINRRVAENIESEALCFYAPLPSETMSPTELVVFALRSLGGFDYAIIVLATLAATLMGLAPITATKLLFGTVIPSGSQTLILPLICLFVGIAVSKALFKLVSSLISARIATRIKIGLETSVYARLMFLDPSFFKGESPGSIANRVLAIPSLVSSLSKCIFELGLTAIMSLVYVSQIVRYAPALALPALVTLLAEIVATIVTIRVTESYHLVELQKENELSGATPEVLHGIQKLKLSGAETRAFSYWADYYADAARATYGFPTLVLAAPNLIPLIGLLGIVLIYGIAATSSVAVDDFMAFNCAFGAAAGAIGELVKGIPLMSQIRPLIDLLDPILQATPETLGDRKPIESIDGSIEVSRLSFKYGKDLPLILDNVSFRIRPGEYVAIVGPSGCGKSTLMRVLLGFERPTRGTVQYGQHDISKVDVRSLRQHMGVVLQNGSLFVGDLLSNITVASPTASVDDAWEAAEIACIADDIRDMPMGMHTLVSANGGGFSGGQRQRILIARAVCGKPSILMFDEATSALDNIAQRHVSEALDDLKCTRIVIAHRLSTIRSCDRIIMLDGGHIVDEGTYDELVARGGAFAELVERQRVEGED